MTSVVLANHEEGSMRVLGDQLMEKEVFGYDGDKFRTEDFAVENCGSVGYTVGGGWVRGFSGDWYPSSSPLISPSRAGGRASPRHPRRHPCSFRSTPPLYGKDRSNYPVYTATRWFAKLISLPLSLSRSVFLHLLLPVLCILLRTRRLRVFACALNGLDV